MDAWSIKTLVGEREETLIDRAEISKKEWRDAHISPDPLRLENPIGIARTTPGPGGE